MLVYKIIHNESDICYIGSTKNTLPKRWNQHKSDYKKWLENKSGLVSIYPYFKEFGIENFKIILIKKCNVETKQELFKFEQIAIENHSNCVNIQNAYTNTKEYHKIYYEENKNILKERSTNYYNNNKEEILLKQVNYRNENREKIRLKDKEKYICENCNKELAKTNKSRHNKTCDTKN